MVSWPIKKKKSGSTIIKVFESNKSWRKRRNKREGIRMEVEK